MLLCLRSRLQGLRFTPDYRALPRSRKPHTTSMITEGISFHSSRVCARELEQSSRSAQHCHVPLSTRTNREDGICCRARVNCDIRAVVGAPGYPNEPAR